MTELTEQQVLERAQHAKRLLDDDLFQEMVLTEEESIQARWRMALTTELRGEAWFELRSLHRLTQRLRSLFDEADFLKDQLEKKKRHEQ